VISRPETSFGGVMQCDCGKAMREERFERTGSLNRPLDVLLRAIASMRAMYMTEGATFPRVLSEMGGRFHYYALPSLLQPHRLINSSRRTMIMW
jgi:hypothetical protein